MSIPHRRHASGARPDLVAQAGTEIVRATVCAVLPEFSQAHLETADGRLLAVTARTGGIELPALQVGQTLECEVTLKQPRVLRAQRIA